MDNDTKKFLEKHFKSGQYATVTILVKNCNLKDFLDHLQKANLNLAVMPHIHGMTGFTKKGNNDGKPN